MRIQHKQTKHESSMMHQMRRSGAAGWAFLVWLFGGGLTLAIIVFILLKVMGG